MRSGVRGGAAHLAVSVVLLAAAGCGTARSGPPAAADPAAATFSARATQCIAEPRPLALPPVDAVVDSAALVAHLAGLRALDPPPDGHVLLSLAFDAAGSNVRREVVEHATRPLVADSVQRLVFATRRQVEEAEAEWGVRLRVELGERVALGVARRELCPARARDLELNRAMQTYQPAGVRFRRGMRERTVFMRAYVNAAGVITTAHVLRGEARGSSLEREIALHLRQFLFDPARVDGIPTGSWVEIPVRVRT